MFLIGLKGGSRFEFWVLDSVGSDQVRSLMVLKFGFGQAPTWQTTCDIQLINMLGVNEWL